MKITWQGVLIGVGVVVTCPVWIPAMALGLLVKVAVIGFKSGYNYVGE